MGALTFAQARDLTKAAVNVLQKTELYANNNATNYDGLFDTLIAANLGDWQAQVMAAAKGHRGGLSALLSPATVQAILNPCLAEWANAIGAPEGLGGDFFQNMFRIREDAVATPRSVKSRNFTYGAVSAVTGTGNGTIRRLTVDDEGFNLEGCHSETKTFECRQDQSQREKHTELFEVRGAVPVHPDWIKLTGSGIVTSIAALTTKDAQTFVANPTFSQYGGTTQPAAGSEQVFTSTTAATNWTVTTAANAKISLGPSDAAYRDLIGETNKYTVRFTDVNTISQTLNSVMRPQFTQRQPYYLQIAVYRENLCDGNLVLTFGATTRTVAMSTLTNAAWNIVTLTMDKGLFPRNFRTNDMVVSFQLTGRTTGTLYLDDIIIAPMIQIGGLFYALIGGSTPFLKGDKMTVADTENATRGIMSYWLCFRSGLWTRFPGFSLPSKTDTFETITDPT